MVGNSGVTHLERLIQTRCVAHRVCACHHAAPVPTYDYQCRKCGHITEVIHSMLEDGPTACERCGGELRRVFHPTGIIFKGGGFYKTDSRSTGSTAAAESSSPATPNPSVGDGAGATAPSDGGGSGSSGSSASAGKPTESGGG